MGPKRIYKRCNMSIAENELEPSDPANIYANKRGKPSPPSPKGFPHSHILSGGGRPRRAMNHQQRSSNTNSINSMKDRKFNGPTSLPSDAMDQEEDFLSSHPLTHAKLKPAPAISSDGLYGGGRTGIDSYSVQLKNYRRAEKQKTAMIHDLSDDSSTEGGIKISGNGVDGADKTATDEMDIITDDTELAPAKSIMRGGCGLSAAEASERIFQGREYRALPVAVPKKTLYSESIESGSALATMWTKNQTHSPLLQLPSNVRQLIYQYTLGGNSIEFKFKTYRNGKPCMKYVSKVYHEECNPFADRIPQVPVTMGMTLLNNVCRQMYLETYTLPYSLNTFWFHNRALFNFVVMEDTTRLLPQQLQAFRSIVVLHYRPEPAVIHLLSNLENVRVVWGLPPGEGGRFLVVEKGKGRELVRDTSQSKVNVRDGVNGPRAGYRGHGIGNGSYGNRNGEHRNDSGLSKNRVKALRDGDTPWSRTRFR